MHEAYSAKEISMLRQATELAAILVGTNSDYDKADLANYVLSAHQTGVTDINDLAYRASQQFLLWNLKDEFGPGQVDAGQDQPSPE